MAHSPFVTFIICTYNRADYLQDALQSLKKSANAFPSIEILIVDNNSDDETQQVVQEIARATPGIDLRYVQEQNQGLSFARNRGIREAKAPYVVFLDDDIIPSKPLVHAWVSFFREHPEACAAGGRIHVQFDDPRPRWISHFLLPLLGHHDLGDRSRLYPKNKYPFGGNMGFKTSIFENIGFFNTGLGRKGDTLNAGEEKELFSRIRSASRPVYYVPNALLYHRVNKERLTIPYIRKQALGLGQSMQVRLSDATPAESFVAWLGEARKTLVSVPLALGYLCMMEPAKARMLFQFRKWIWEGFQTHSEQ